MKNVTQITLTNRERWLIAQLMHVATAFLAKVYAGEPWDEYDMKVVARLNIPTEIEALCIKLNLDKFKSE